MSEDNTVLITGFGPFGTHTVNASWVAVQTMVKLFEELRLRNGEPVGSYKLATREVPVSYSFVESNLERIYDETSPILCIHVGVSPYSIVKIEKFGKNFGYFGPDVDGKVPCNGICKEKGPMAIESSINLKQVCEKLADKDIKGVKVGISEDAGRYLCDFIYYNSLHLGRCPVVFVHVPPLNDPYSSDQLGQTLLHLVDVLVQEHRKA